MLTVERLPPTWLAGLLVSSLTANGLADGAREAHVRSGGIPQPTVTASFNANEQHPRLGACGRPDALLERISLHLARSRQGASGAQAKISVNEGAELLGLAQVWPRAFIATGKADVWNQVQGDLGKWLSAIPSVGERRCGISVLQASSGETVLVVAVVDAWAELSPLPQRGRLGQWLTFDARLLVPLEDPEVFLLGPSGMPRRLLSSTHRNRIRASFSLDQSGPFTVQLMARDGAGPRPVLQWRIEVSEGHSGSSAERSVDSFPDHPFDSSEDPSVFLLRRLNELRAGSNLPSLHRRTHLDAVALEHARRMKSAGMVGHDLGQGGPDARLQEHGIPFEACGENVAMGPSLLRAVEGLEQSPSHRMNMLSRRFDAVGTGVVSDEEGNVWVVEVFAQQGASVAAPR